MKNKKLELFMSFFKIGLFTFGGGYAMITLLEHEFVNNKKIISKKEFMDIVAVSESTPGPVAINMATYIGYKIDKFLGALISTLAVSLPSFIIIYLISIFFDKFISLKYVSYAFEGIRVCTIYLIFLAGLKLLKNLEKNIFNKIIISLVIIVFLTLSLLSINFSTIIYIIICGLIGIFIFNIKKSGEIK